MKTRLLIPLFLVFYFLILSTCSKTASRLLISDKDESNLGTEFHQQLLDSVNTDGTKPFPVFDPGSDPARLAFKAYADSVFNSIIISVPEDEHPDYDFTFTIIDQDVVNAFAVPGGYIYIYTGILKALQNEAEMAAILAHEVAHVTQHHYARTVYKQTIYGTLVEALVGSESALSDFVKGAFGVLAGSYVSRDHEYEADEFGTKYLAASERNPRGIVF
ncbi:M48 family metalloprotease [Fibrobacterota bacterium]